MPMTVRVAAIACLGGLSLSACANGASSPESAEAVSATRREQTVPGGSAVSSSAGVRASAGQGSTVPASCVETYDRDALGRRAFAFDGDLVALEPTASPGPSGERVGDASARATFAVGRWYRGGAGDTVVVRSWGLGRNTSTGGRPVAVGQRLLVAGEDDIAWDCGFTQPWEADRENEWRAVFTPGRSHRVASHCGVVSTTVDGVLWLADPVLGDHNPPPGWDENETSGTFVARDDTEAEFTTDSGQVARFRRAADGTGDPSRRCE